MECGICYELIKNSCVGSCIHHFCYTCMIKWCKHSNNCPKCRFPIREIRHDTEFDFINGALNNEINMDIDTKYKRKILFPENTLAGITLKNNNKGPISRIDL